MTASVHRSSRLWSPQDYLRFARERERPAADLIAQVLASVDPSRTVQRIADVGCGPGNTTRLLRNAWPQASVLCVDTSREMLDRARAVHADSAKVFYEQQDFEAFAGSTSEKPLDVIYSNSALHWVSFEVQKTLLPRLLSRLVPGGIIAFQIPDTRVQPSHLLMRTAAAATNLPVESVRWVTCERDPRDYYEILAPHCSQVTLWSTDYTLVLNGENPVADFTASTGLGPYIDKAGGPDSDAGKLFVEKYRQMIAEAYPKNADGATLFNFKRFFAVATKKVL